MRVKTNELTGAALDWAVAKIEAERKLFTIYPQYITPYSTDWAQGGPIIEREELSRLICYNHNEWGCLNGEVFCEGPTPLISAMRCYVASKLGDEVEIPEELV
jgi:hypothetical protein